MADPVDIMNVACRLRYEAAQRVTAYLTMNASVVSYDMLEQARARFLIADRDCSRLMIMIDELATPAIDTAALDRAVRRTPILLTLARRVGADADLIHDTARSLRWIIVERYHQEVSNGPVRTAP